jgi:hypothetical protein
MIPKTIHYCWFGKKPFPKRMKQWMQSWKKYCPTYTFSEWNEENFDVSLNLYARQAYNAEKWAFVSDYVRLYALYHHGGVYLDTDIELLKPVDIFLNDKAFAGFESADFISTAVMGAEKGHAFIKFLLSDYDKRTFIKEDGAFDYETNTVRLTRHCRALGLLLNNRKQTVMDFMFYPSDYFSPGDWLTKKVECTANTYAIHHFDASWKSLSQKIRDAIGRRFPLLVAIKKKLG